jgi:hypothetical protein
MNKAASIKAGLRSGLSQRGAGETASISRPDANSAAIAMGPWTLDMTFSEYNDDGDPATESEHDTIYSALETIVTEHNA